MQPLVLQAGIFKARTGPQFAEGEMRSLNSFGDEFSEVLQLGHAPCFSQAFLLAAADNLV